MNDISIALGSARRLPAVLVCAAMLACASDALADTTAADRATADALFREGRTLLNQKKYADACPKLEESHRLDPQAGTLLSLAMCHEGQGKLASAWVEFEESVSLARRANRHDRVRIANQRLKGLEKRVPHLTIEVGPDMHVDGLVVTRNGAEVGRPVWGTAVPVDPGEVEIVAEAPGRRPWRMTVKLEERDDKTVVLPQLAEEPKPVAPTPPPAPKPQAEKKQGGVSRTTWGLIAGGAGIAALGAGGYFGLRAMGKSADSDDHCRGTLCDARGVELNDQADSAAWLSNIFVGVGLVGVGAGTWLLLTDDQKPGENQESAPPSAGTFVTPVARQGGAAILLTGSW